MPHFHKKEFFHDTSAGILVCCVVPGFCVLSAPVRAENEGQADLDKAVQLKVAANTLSDLTEVIRLAESAIEQGPGQGQYRICQ